jgi:hypothetical protein
MNIATFMLVLFMSSSVFAQLDQKVLPTDKAVETVYYADMDAYVPVSNQEAYVGPVSNLTGDQLALVTTFADNNGQSGNMFDLTATNTVTIKRFSTNITDFFPGFQVDMEIYFKVGTYNGFNTNPNAWTQVGERTSVTPAGQGLPTEIPIDVDVVIPAGETYSFYVTCTNATLNYTNGTVEGAPFASDANLTFFQGIGLGYAFGGAFRPRIFNGIIHYELGGSGGSVGIFNPDEEACGGDTSSSFDEDTGIYNLNSSGCFYGSPYNADALASLNTELCGDGEIIAKFEGGSGLGWGGLAMRETLDPGSKKIQLMQNGSFFARREIRTMTNAPAFPQQSFAFGKPWMRLERVGNQFRAYVSANGINWQFVSAANINMDDCIQVGLVATSGNPLVDYSADFSNVQFSPADAMELTIENPSITTSSEHAIGAFPNPNTGSFTVQLPIIEQGTTLLQMFDQTGKNVYQEQVSDIRHEINLQNQSPGMYFLRITQPNGQVTTEKVIIQ